MGLLSSSSSSTQNFNDSRSNVDNSAIDFGIGGNNKYNGGNTYGDLKSGGNLSVTTTDYGAIEGAVSIAGSALSSVDNSVGALSAGFNSSLQSLNSIAKNSIQAVKDSYQSDNKSITQSAIMWGGFVALGFIALKVLK